MARHTIARHAHEIESESESLGLPSDLDSLLAREWLVTNGLGSYASSTIPGLNTRKYHGLLVAAMSPPTHTAVLLSRTEETVTYDGQDYPLDCNEYPGVIFPRGDALLKEFDSAPNPRWLYAGGAWKLQRELRLVEGQNSVVLTYTNVGESTIELAVRPMLALRSVHALTYQWNGLLRVEKHGKTQLHVPATVRTPEIFIAHDGAFSASAHWYLNQIYRLEERRGYAALEDLWTPGIVRYTLEPGQTTHLVCSADPIDWATAMRTPAQRKAHEDPTLRMLMNAAEQFIVRVPATGMTTSVAGYPWLDPSPRTQLIAFTGMFLCTRRFDDARKVLLNLASKFDSGLLHDEAADVSLWFINAIWNYQRYTADANTSRPLLDLAADILNAFRGGSAAGVRITSERLIDYRATERAVTWMNGRIGDCVITPRQGLAVETNALWFNANRIVAELAQKFSRLDASAFCGYASEISAAFNQLFWNGDAGCCFDVIDGDAKDGSIRPNQLLSISLPFAALNPAWHASLINVVGRELLTPYGLRTLERGHPAYRAWCEGNVETREHASFNGAVHPWLLTHYVRASMKIGRGRRSREDVAAVIEPLMNYMAGHAVGQLPELFDGDFPHLPGGAPASAVSVCELLGCYVEDVLGRGPSGSAIRSGNPARVMKGIGASRARNEQHSSSPPRRVLS